MARGVREVRGGGGGGGGAVGGRRGAAALLRAALPPAGGEDALPPDYLAFQSWDAAQGLCSYVRGMLVNAALLEGLGVGRAGSTAAAAAMQTFWKDASGQLAGVGFAASCGPAFDAHPKEFRFLADCLNNLGLVLSLLAPRLAAAGLFLPLACAGSACAAACGVAAGASRAAFGQHFAQGRAGLGLGDLQAKEGTQETVVSLAGMAIGTLVLRLAGEALLAQWVVFVALTVAHLFCNARAVRALALATLNQNRLSMLLSGFLDSKGKALSPREVAALEGLLPPPLMRLLSLDRGPRVVLGARLGALQTAQGWSPPRPGDRAHLLCRSRSGDVLVGLHTSVSTAEMAEAFCRASVALRLWETNGGDWPDAEEGSLAWTRERYGDFLAALRRSGWLVDEALADGRALGVGAWRLVWER